MDWSKDECLRAIDLYKAESVLWSKKHPLYYDKKRKGMAWATVATAMNVDVPTFKRKMNSLLGSFRRERTKYCRINASVPGHLEAYTPRWFAYDKMTFLLQDSADRDYYTNTSADAGYYENNDECDVNSMLETSHDIPVKDENSSFKNESDDYMESDNFPEVDNSFNEKYVELRNVAGMSHQAAMRQAMLETGLKMEDQAGSSSQATDDVFTVYGQYVANKLRSYDSVTRAVVEHAINEILFGADLGKYSEVPKLHKSFTHISVPVYKSEPDEICPENDEAPSSPPEVKPEV